MVLLQTVCLWITDQVLLQKTIELIESYTKKRGSKRFIDMDRLNGRAFSGKPHYYLIQPMPVNRGLALFMAVVLLLTKCTIQDILFTK
jgi:hypothetical protein